MQDAIREGGFLRPWRRKPGVGGRGGLLASLLLGAAALLVYFVLAEMAVRFATGTSILRFGDLRREKVVHDALNTSILYDSRLGWRMAPNVRSGNFNTGPRGFRVNGEAEDLERTEPEPPVSNAVLAVGSSFTAGSEVEDQESWPANLQALLGRKVYNAGVGGYGADQIVLNAEHLIPVLRPKVVVVDLLADNILAAAYSSYGRAKPFFTIEDGALLHHNDPVPESSAKHKDALKSALGHSILADRFLTAFFPDYWNTSGASDFRKTSVDPVEITCRLLERLKDKTDAENIRLIVVLQFAGPHILQMPEEPVHSLLVRECAMDSGIQVLDEYDALKEVQKRSVAELRALYVKEPDGTTGHKSPSGNLRIAQTLEAALLSPAPVAARRARQPGPVYDVPEFPTNAVPQSEALQKVIGSPSHARFASEFAWWFQDRVYKIEARGAAGEHYVSLSVPNVKPGPLLASMEVRADGTERFRLQLRTNSGEGVLSDIDLNAGTGEPTRLGKVRKVGNGVEDVGGGWYRVWLRATIPELDRTGVLLIMQLANNNSGATGFAPLTEAVKVRRIQVMNALEPHAYMPTE